MLSGRLSINKGMIVENSVAQMLRASVHPKDLKTEDGILHLPLYMTPLMIEIPS